MAMVISDGDYVWDSDAANVSQAEDNTGAIFRGGSVTVSGTNSLVLAVGSVAYVAGGSFYWKQATYYPTIAAAGSFDRIDLVCGSQNGSIFVVAGTQATDPSPPNMPANNALFAYVNVGSNVSTVANSNLVDKRLQQSRGAFKQYYYATVSGTVIQSGTAYSTLMTVVIPGDTGRMVRFNGLCGNGVSQNNGSWTFGIGVNDDGGGTKFNPSGLEVLFDGMMMDRTGVITAANNGLIYGRYAGGGQANVINEFRSAGSIWGGSINILVRYHGAGSMLQTGMIVIEETLVNF